MPFEQWSHGGFHYPAEGRMREVAPQSCQHRQRMHDVSQGTRAYEEDSAGAQGVAPTFQSGSRRIFSIRSVVE